MEKTIHPIAKIRTDFPEKFGIPRQSGLVENIGQIIFEPEYRRIESIKGLEQFSHIWLIWNFSENPTNEHFSPTVRPPRLGGNTRLGVFATRSPFRPNGLGLSLVRIEKIDTKCNHAPIIYVAGADILDNTDIYDIKPYLPYVESIPNAKEGFTNQSKTHILNVQLDESLYPNIPKNDITNICQLLAHDPRPAYIDDNNRRYGMKYKHWNIIFYVQNNKIFVEDIQNT